MSNTNPPLFPMRLSEDDKTKLDALAQRIGTASKAATIRYLIRQAARNLDDQANERRLTPSVQAI